MGFLEGRGLAEEAPKVREGSVEMNWAEQVPEGEGSRWRSRG